MGRPNVTATPRMLMSCKIVSSIECLQVSKSRCSEIGVSLKSFKFNYPSTTMALAAINREEQRHLRKSTFLHLYP